MLKIYLTKEVRLHFWDSRLKVPNVSTIHNHPWDFTSLVLKGELCNILYQEVEGEKCNYEKALIRCGEQAATMEAPIRVQLKEVSRVTYGKGEYYSELAEKLHESCPKDSAITIVERYPKQDPDHASVFWPIGTNWVNATPRTATREEIDMVLENAKS